MATFSPTVQSIREVDHVNLTSEYDVTFQAVVEGLNRYGLPVVILVGILGNSVSFMVYAASELRHQSSSVYLAFLNLVDMVFLLCMSVVWLGWVRVYIIHRPGWCQLVVYLSYVSAFLSVWTVVLFTVERCIVVYFPLARLVHCTRKRALIVIAGLSVVGLGLYACSLWTTGVLKVKGRGNACLTLPEYEPMAKTLSNVDTFITLAVPSLLIIVLNLLITRKIWGMVRLGSSSPASGPLTATLVSRIADEASEGQPESEGAGEDPESPLRDLALAASPEVEPVGPWEKFDIEEDGQRRGPLCRLRAWCRRCGGFVRRSTSPPRSSHAHRPSLGATTATTDPQPSLRRHHQRASHTAIQLSTTRTLLVISSLFVLLNLPSHAFRLYVTVGNLLHSNTAFSRNLLLWQQVFIMLYYANFGLNFFMYCACSRKFRCELGKCARILVGWCTRKYHSL